MFCLLVTILTVNFFSNVFTLELTDYEKFDQKYSFETEYPDGVDLSNDFEDYETDFIKTRAKREADPDDQDDESSGFLEKDVIKEQQFPLGGYVSSTPTTKSTTNPSTTTATTTAPTTTKANCISTPTTASTTMPTTTTASNQVTTSRNEPEGSKEFEWRTKDGGHLHLQVLVGVDETVVKFHGRSVLEQYILTQMSIVNDIYHHESLGVEVNVVVTKLVVIDAQTSQNILVRNEARSTLDRFCDWANRQRRPVGSQTGSNFDLAIYLTRDSFGPAGYASVTGMCVPERSCAIIKDDGTSSAFVIAHEIGHVFGMIHDGHGNDCSSDASDGRIMAAMVQSNYHMHFWSTCSRDVIQKRLKSSEYQCLLDKPVKQLKPRYSQPFGQSWSLDEQCRQEFGSEFNLCKAFEGTDPCKLLWCGIGSNSTICKTKRGPPLPGTTCARGKWCMDGTCQERRSIATNGGWSDWGAWGKCSKSCNFGAQFRTRSCSNPRPSYGGNECWGEDEELRICNEQPCPIRKDYRLEQCSLFNEKRFDGNKRHHWIPTENNNKTELCKLTCQSKETGLSFVSESDVVDGTFCHYDDEHSICIQGHCKEVGCDGVLNSRRRFDSCGRCGGDSKECQKVRDNLLAVLGIKEYHSFVIIPKHARNIIVRERSSRPHLAHFLAIRDALTEEWVLNGGANQTTSKIFVSHGALFSYTSTMHDGESILAKGPLLSPIEILVFSQSNKISAAVDVEYTISKAAHLAGKTESVRTSQGTPLTPPLTQRYEWVVSGWSECSKTCDAGYQTEKWACLDKTKQRIVDGFCSHRDRQEGKRECNMRPCLRSQTTVKTTARPEVRAKSPYWWQAGEWSACSVSCGPGGLKGRHVSCVTKEASGNIRAIEPAYCNPRIMPPYILPCEIIPCTASVVISAPLLSKMAAFRDEAYITSRPLSNVKVDSDRKNENDSEFLNWLENSKEKERVDDCFDVDKPYCRMMASVNTCHSFFEKFCCTSCSSLKRKSFR